MGKCYNKKLFLEDIFEYLPSENFFVSLTDSIYCNITFVRCYYGLFLIHSSQECFLCKILSEKRH